MDISKISPIVVTTYRPKQEVIDLRQERPGERVPIVVNGEVELVDPQTTCPTCFVTNTKRGPDGRCDLCGELWPPDEVKLAATEREEDEFLADSEEDEVAELRDDFNTALEHLEEWQHIAEALLAEQEGRRQDGLEVGATAANDGAVLPRFLRAVFRDLT
jgi:hypothetical protein